MANNSREPMGEDFLEILEGIRLALSYLGTGRPPGSTSRGALELVAGSISGESGSLAEEMSRIAGSLDSIARALDETNRIRRARLSATESFHLRLETSGEGGFELFPSDASETVHEFLNDWFILSDDSDAWVTRRHVNELYTFWCENNLISPEDRVTTSVLRRSLQLLGVGLTQGHSDQKKARTYVFTGIKVRDGAYSR